jgi:large subunit ribosomal protein L23
MTVELAKPFQWPDLPEDLTPWSNQLWKMREDLMEKRNDEHLQQQRFKIPLKSKAPVSKERQELAELAKKLMSGEEKWTNDVVLDPKWEKILGNEQKAVEPTKEA